MKQFAIGMLTGVIGFGSIAAAPASNPCAGWIMDVALYEACLLTACDGDRNHVANLKALYGRCFGIHSGQENTTYTFEIDKDRNLKRRVDDLNDTLLEIAVQEMKKAEAAAKAREAISIRTVDA